MFVLVAALGRGGARGKYVLDILILAAPIPSAPPIGFPG